MTRVDFLYGGDISISHQTNFNKKQLPKYLKVCLKKDFEYAIRRALKSIKS